MTPLEDARAAHPELRVIPDRVLLSLLEDAGDAAMAAIAWRSRAGIPTPPATPATDPAPVARPASGGAVPRRGRKRSGS